MVTFDYGEGEDIFLSALEKSVPFSLFHTDGKAILRLSAEPPKQGPVEFFWFYWRNAHAAFLISSEGGKREDYVVLCFVDKKFTEEFLAFLETFDEGRFFVEYRGGKRFEVLEEERLVDFVTEFARTVKGVKFKKGIRGCPTCARFIDEWQNRSV